ncbi:MAG: type II CAAX endopeptidase family protein [Cyanobacteriota bacterium]|nr:type II CAAX endopeptidase family protein [Cyanobacteriota bacterium]
MTDPNPPLSGPAWKRLLLVMVTALVSLVLLQSLVNSWNQPQVASQLELYQTDLLLQSSAWKFSLTEPWGGSEEDWQGLRQGLLGKDPVATAEQQYEKVQKRASTNLNSLSSQETTLREAGQPLGRRQQGAQVQQRQLIDQIDLRLGLMEAYQGQVEAALGRWRNLANRPTTGADLTRTAHLLTRLWQDSRAEPGDEEWLQTNLEGWFEYRALDQLYRVAKRPLDQQRLQTQEQGIAANRLVKLVLISTLPAISALLGLGLLLGLLGQWLWQRQDSLLAGQGQAPWSIPWTGETIWEVLMVGFFFIGQIALPIVLAGLGLSSADLSNRQRAFLSLGYYLLMAIGGLTVLWWCLRPYRPLPAGLFTLKPSWQGLLWGLGGYLVALPLMFGVALLNQQLWQGQGGSNPLLQTVLEERDPVALVVFFVTAALAAPLFEETLFRGFLLPSLSRYMGLPWAIGLSGLIFATAHLSLSEILPLTLLGIVLGFVYSRSRNLLSPMVLHSLWNGATMAGLLILGS